jgi:hypothetical protein
MSLQKQIYASKHTYPNKSATFFIKPLSKIDLGSILKMQNPFLKEKEGFWGLLFLYYKNIVF